MEPAKSQNRNHNITYIHTLSYGSTLPGHDVTYGTELCIHNMHTHTSALLWPKIEPTPFRQDSLKLSKSRKNKLSWIDGWQKLRRLSGRLGKDARHTKELKGIPFQWHRSIVDSSSIYSHLHPIYCIIVWHQEHPLNDYFNQLRLSRPFQVPLEERHFLLHLSL